ncbi:MAG: putative anti-sigma-factor antagonist [Proteobacteria bacterium]|nr:putative anti-sigma-factor antagonist [Pseudomonadota bacterium]
MINLIEKRGSFAVVAIDIKRIDAQNACMFRDELTALLNAGSASLILDMSAVEFVDSSGLGALVGVFKSIGPRGDLALASPRPPVEKMLKLTRMDRVFRLFGTLREAVEAIAGVGSS